MRDYDAGAPLRASAAAWRVPARGRTRRTIPRLRCSCRTARRWPRPAPSSMSRAMTTACCATFRCARLPETGACLRCRCGSQRQSRRTPTAGLSAVHPAELAREHARLPRLSAADLLVEAPPVCRRGTTPLPECWIASCSSAIPPSGLNDAKPTPVDPVMPGVEVHGGGDRGIRRRQRDPCAAGRLQIRHRGLAGRGDGLCLLPRRAAQRHRLDLRCGKLLAARCRFHRAHVLRFLFRHLRHRRLRQSRLRPVPHLRRESSADEPSATATTCRSSTRRGIAGSRSRACDSCRTPGSTRSQSRGAAASIAAGCGASCTLAPTP